MTPFMGKRTAHSRVAQLAMVFYLAGVLGFANVPLWNSLSRLAGGGEIPPCGCLDPDCQCGAPCCSPEARSARSADGPACCSVRESATGCACTSRSEAVTLKPACLCGSPINLAQAHFGESHVPAPGCYSGSSPQPVPVPSHPEPQIPAPACFPLEKVPITS
jgi:hypothetical protein